MCHKPQLDLRIVSRDELASGRRDKGGSDLPSSAVRIGIFCTFGSDDESLPVLAPTIENDVNPACIWQNRLDKSVSIG